MQELFLATGVVLIVLLSSFAQNVKPVSAAGDAVLKLETEGDEHLFFLGELIPVKLSYSAGTPG